MTLERRLLGLVLEAFFNNFPPLTLQTIQIISTLYMLELTSYNKVQRDINLE